MPNRFDYVKFDEKATNKQAKAKELFQQLETWVNDLPDGRAKSLIFTKLEEAYAWVGKAVRDEQIATRGAELQEARGNE